MNRTDVLMGAVTFAIALLIALAVSAWSLFRAAPAVPRPARAAPTTEDRTRPHVMRLASVRVWSDVDRRATSVTVVGSEPTIVQPPKPPESTDERSGADVGLEERLEEVIGVDLGDLGEVGVGLVDVPVAEDRVVDDALEPVGALVSID